MADIDEVVAHRRVIEAIDALFIATDEKNWEGVKACFTKNVRFDMSSAGGGPERERPAEEIADEWARNLAGLQAIHHQAGNYRVRLLGTRAEASCYGIAYHYLPKASGRSTRVFVGSYDFELVRDAERFRISAFRYNLKFIEGNRELETSD